MATDTYNARGLVLRKTKLGEADLIVTLLADDGRQLRAVAKGARKPTSSFASRLELFAEADLLLARGKSLDIAKEARLENAHLGLRADAEHAAAAAPVADALYRLSQPDLPAPRLYALAASALSHMEAADAGASLALCAACLLKAFAFAGFRPSLSRCVACGAPLPPGDPRVEVSFSPAEGGAVCSDCLVFASAVPAGSDALAYASFLMMSTFDDIAAAEASRRLSLEALRLCQAWSREHLGARLKSLDFLFSCGLF